MISVTMDFTDSADIYIAGRRPGIGPRGDFVMVALGDQRKIRKDVISESEAVYIAFRTSKFV